MAAVSAPVLFLALLQPWLSWQIGELPVGDLSISVHYRNIRPCPLLHCHLFYLLTCLAILALGFRGVIWSLPPLHPSSDACWVPQPDSICGVRLS